MDSKNLSERLKLHLSGFAQLNKLTLREKRNRLPHLSVEESLCQFLELESFAEASGSLTKPAAFTLRSYRHIFVQREVFRKLAEHA
ncbi:MAG: hypothetical protein ACOYL3_07330 [Desulfuromonadaceae bacterium]